MSKRTFHAAFDETVVRVFSNTEDGIAAFCASMSGHPTIGIEATGAYHLHFCSALVARGYAVRVLNPLESSRVIAAQGLRRVKTDRTDARAIRQAVLLNLGYPFTDTPEILALKALVVERHGLVRLGTMLKQQREAHQAKEHAVGRLHDSSTAVLAAIRTEILRIEAQFPRYAPETQALLRTIPGVGRLTAAALVAFVGDIRRFNTPEKLVAYLGLDCRVHESGTSIKGKGYLTKRGNKYLRHILFAAAFIARRHNPTLRAFFERKIEEGKHYTVALCAVERKLVHLIFAVWTRGTPYESR